MIRDLNHSPFALADETVVVHNAVGLRYNLKNKVRVGKKNRNFRNGFHGR